MNKLKTILTLFLTMFKIGAFTFGGGFAMMALMEHELIDKRKWIEREDFYDLLAVAVKAGLKKNQAEEIFISMKSIIGKAK